MIKRILYLVLCSFLFSSIAFGAGLDADTKLLMHMEGSDEGTTFSDSSTTNNKGNASVTADVDTEADQKKWSSTSAQFDGDSGYLTYADDADWDFVGSNSDDWTTDMWVKHTDHVSWEYYVSHWEDDNNYWSLRHYHSSGLRFYVIADPGPAVIIDTGGGGEITDTNWHHVAACKISDEYACYLDGSQVNYTQDSDTDTFAGSLYMGQRGAANYFDGYIDELRIQKSNYFTASPTPTPFTHFKCNDDAANTTVTDNGTGSNTGTSSTNTSNLSVVGKINDAFEFTSASSEYINIDAVNTDVKSDTVGTITFWTNPDSVAGGVVNEFICFGDTDGDTRFRIASIDDHLYFDIELASTGRVEWYIDNVVATGWHHWAFSQNGTALVIYKDGSDITESPTTSGTGSAGSWFGLVSSGIDNGRIGNRSYNNSGETNYYDGITDDVRYYQSTALSSSQVGSIYNSGSGTEDVYFDTITTPTEEYSSAATGQVIINFIKLEDESGYKRVASNPKTGEILWED